MRSPDTNGDFAIRAEGLGKLYRISDSRRSRSLREALTEGTANAVRQLVRPSAGRRGKHDFWALQDVSFEVRPGESVGLIGPNGSGKSTLLKIISRIVTPTTGQAIIRGRVGALLEVGTGFHPELTGRENIFLNGAIIGMSGQEIRRRFDQIVDFSGVEEFLNVPIKRYSSGMVMRLAFAVAAHLEPDVLIIDEVLAVGDAEFQAKCLGRMSEVANSGCTVFFVSHNLGAVQRLCSRAMLMSHGKLVADGSVSEVTGRYLNASGTRGSPGEWVALPAPDGNRPAAAFSGVRYSDPLAPASLPRSTGPMRIEAEVDATSAFRGVIAVDITDEFGTKLVNLDVWTHHHRHVDFPAGKSVWQFDIEALYLNPGRYVIALWLESRSGGKLDYRTMAERFTLLGADGLLVEGDYDAVDDGLVPCRFAIRQVESLNVK